MPNCTRILQNVIIGLKVCHAGVSCTISLVYYRAWTNAATQVCWAYAELHHHGESVCDLDRPGCRNTHAHDELAEEQQDVNPKQRLQVC